VCCISIIAPIGNPRNWSYVKYYKDDSTYLSCASFVALAKFLSDRGCKVHLTLVVPDSVPDDDITCLIREVERALNVCPDILKVEAVGSISGIRYEGDLLAIPTAVIALSLREYLRGNEVVVDLTHGWNVLPTLSMYAIALIGSMLKMRIFITEPFIGGEKKLPRCGEDTEKIQDKELEFPILRITEINIERVRSKLNTDIGEIMNIIHNLKDNSIIDEDSSKILEYVTLSAEYYRRGIITLGWYYIYKILNSYENITEKLRSIVENIINNEIKVTDERRKLYNNTIRYTFKCSHNREALLYLMYDLAIFVKILQAYEKVNYKTGKPGQNLKFSKVESILEDLYSSGILDENVYSICMVEIEKIKKAKTQSYTRSTTSREEVVDIVEQAKVDKEKAYRNILAHCGLVNPIVREVSSMEVKINVDNNIEDLLKNMLIEFSNKYTDISRKDSK